MLKYLTGIGLVTVFFALLITVFCITQMEKVYRIGYKQDGSAIILQSTYWYTKSKLFDLRRELANKECKEQDCAWIEEAIILIDGKPRDSDNTIYDNPTILWSHRYTGN